MTKQMASDGHLAGIGQCKSSSEKNDDAPRHLLIDGRPVKDGRSRTRRPILRCNQTASALLHYNICTVTGRQREKCTHIHRHRQTEVKRETDRQTEQEKKRETDR